jgi:hypothetical protein
VKEVLEKITAPINKVIDMVIDKVIAFAKKIIGKVKSGAKKAKEAISEFLWPKKTFSAGEESHTLYFSGSGQPMIRSTPQALESFISAWAADVGSSKTDNQEKHEKAARKTLGEIKKLAATIAKLEKDGKPVPEASQQDMLKLQKEMSESLKGMLGKKSDLAAARARYKLEGLTGTFATIPKPTGDDLTGDHQPQAAVIKLLAGRDYFRKYDEGKEMLHRAQGHANNGYVINLYAARHAEGRTFKSKGGKTKKDFEAAVDGIEKKETDPAELRKKTVDLLKGELSEDVRVMRGVYKDNPKDPIWVDLDPYVANDDDKKTLVSEIRNQVNKGESIIASQPMDVLKG